MEIHHFEDEDENEDEDDREKNFKKHSKTCAAFIDFSASEDLMDFVVHSLAGVGAARLIAPRRKWLPQLSLAGVVGSLLMDGDSWLYLIGPDTYGRYHRLASHSVLGLAVSALVSAGIVRAAGAVRPWRRFGWFVAPNLPKTQSISPAPFSLILLVTAVAAFLHFCFDAITGYGNMEPLWPWSHWDPSLCAVRSFDTFIFSMTLGWHLLIRHLDWPRRREWPLTLAWLLSIVAYVAYRVHAGPKTFW